MDEVQHPVDWAAVRQEYENKEFAPGMICKRHGISGAQLRYRREQEDWPTINARVPRTSELVRRMLRILDKQIRQLEKAMDQPIDKQAKVLGDQVKTLEKLVELGAAKPNVTPPTRRNMTDLREKLAQRIEQFNRR